MKLRIAVIAVLVASVLALVCAAWMIRSGHAPSVSESSRAVTKSAEASTGELPQPPPVPVAMKPEAKDLAAQGDANTPRHGSKPQKVIHISEVTVADDDSVTLLSLLNASGSPGGTTGASNGNSIADLGKSPASGSKKKTTYDFGDDVVEGDLARPDGNALKQQTPPPIERYPNIEAPDTVAIGQEIAVQVSDIRPARPGNEDPQRCTARGQTSAPNGRRREPVEPYGESNRAGNGVYTERQHR